VNALSAALSCLKANDIGFGFAKSSQVRQAMIDVVDIETGDLHWADGSDRSTSFSGNSGSSL
jgi:hypothetical protein